MFLFDMIAHYFPRMCDAGEVSIRLRMILAIFIPHSKCAGLKIEVAMNAGHAPNLIFLWTRRIHPARSVCRLYPLQI